MKITYKQFVQCASGSGIFLSLLAMLCLSVIAQEGPRQPPPQEIQWKVECPVCKDTFGIVPTDIKTNVFKSVSATVYNRSAEATCPQCGTKFTALHQKIVPDVMAEEVVIPISRQRLQERMAARVSAPRIKVVSLLDIDEETLRAYYRTNRARVSLLIVTHSPQ